MKDKKEGNKEKVVNLELERNINLLKDS